MLLLGDLQTPSGFENFYIFYSILFIIIIFYFQYIPFLFFVGASLITIPDTCMIPEAQVIRAQRKQPH